MSSAICSFLSVACAHAQVDEIQPTLLLTVEAYVSGHRLFNFDTDSSYRSLIRIFLAEVPSNAFDATCERSLSPTRPKPQKACSLLWCSSFHKVSRFYDAASGLRAREIPIPKGTSASARWDVPGQIDRAKTPYLSDFD